jgi:ABC-type uncharacterized transport system ATPase subunit
MNNLEHSVRMQGISKSYTIAKNEVDLDLCPNGIQVLLGENIAMTLDNV